MVEQEHSAKQGGRWEVLAVKVCCKHLIVILTHLILTLTLTLSQADLGRPEQDVMAVQEKSCLD